MLKDEKIRFLFLIGVEGSGHHMIRALLNDFLSLRQVVDLAECRWHRMLIEHWDPDVPGNPLKAKLVDKLMGQKSLRDKLGKIFEKDRNEGLTHYFEPASFPFGQPRNTLRRPDVIEFCDWFGDCLEIKPLVIYRDPVSATFSALRRNFTDDWLLQARIIEDNYCYIEKQMQACGTEGFRVLRVEDFLADPSAFVPALGDWWDIDTELISNGLRHIVAPMERNKIPEKARMQLDDFFSGPRRSQWAEIRNERIQLRRSHNAD